MLRESAGFGVTLKLLFILAFFFLFEHFTLSMDSPVPPNNYLVDTWGVGDGLPVDMILTMAQTPDGYLWLGTSKGLVRFDGKRFVGVQFVQTPKLDPSKLDVPDALLVDHNGILWIGSEEGLTSFDYRTKRYKTITTADGLKNDRIRMLYEDSQKNLWIGFVSSYASRYKDGAFRHFDSADGLIGKKINSIVETGNGDLLFASREYGLFYLRDQKFYPYNLACIRGLQIIAMYADHSENLWIATNKGLFRIIDDGGVKRCETYSDKNGLSGNLVTSILEDRHHRLWVGAFKGVNIISKKPSGDLVFDHLRRSNSIVNMMQDQDDSMWISSYNSGLIRLRHPIANYFTPQEAFPNEIFFSIFEDKQGDILFGTTSGKLFRFRGKNLVDIVSPPECSGLNIMAIAQDNEENIWLGTSGGGVFRLSPHGIDSFAVEEGLNDNVVTSIYKDRKGNLWFGTYAGVNFLRPGRSELESLGNVDDLSSKKIHAIYQDREFNIWILTDHGATFLREGNTSPDHAEHFFDDISVSCIRQDTFIGNDAGSLYWVGTKGSGILRAKFFEGGIVTRAFKVEQGMITNTIYRFLEDANGWFWILSNSGILRVAKADLNRLALHGGEPVHCVSFGEHDGIKSPEFAEFSRHVAIRDSDDALWFITRGGIYSMKPTILKTNEFAPPVDIELVTQDGKQVPQSDGAMENTFLGKADWEFRFTSPSLTLPDKVRFKYRLDGFDDHWQYLTYGAPRVASYNKLEAGNYTFEVFACNALGNWSSEPASFAFSVESVYYETVAFKVMMALAFLGLAGLTMYFYWLSRKKSEEKRPPPYQGAQPLHPDFADECLKKLELQMKGEKIYTDPELSLKKLADSIKVSNHQLSRLLNDNLNINFAEFINTHRIDEAKEILADPERSKEKITNIALDVGFNTMPAFYNAFKKYTGMTPSAYKKAMKKKKK